MTIEEYAKEVDLQDQLQQQYFKTRDRNVLQQSKAQERKVRQLTREILNHNLYNKHYSDMNNWNELRDRAYQTAKAHGFHKGDESVEHYLCLVVTELSDAVEADRKRKRANIYRYQVESVTPQAPDHIEKHKDFCFEAFIKDTLEDELADATIRLLDLAGMIELDLSLMPSMVRLCDEQTDLSDFQNATFTEHIFNILREIVNLHVSDAILCSLGSICALAGYMEIDLAKHIELKMEYNNRRIHKHGKQY